MAPLFQRFFSKIESDDSSLLYWLVAFVAIVFLRNFLEGALEFEHTLLAPEAFFIDFLVSYFALFLSLLVALRVLTKTSLRHLIKVLVVLFILILLVPPLDFLVSSGSGYNIKYLRGDAPYLMENLLTYYSSGATPGQRVEGLFFGFLLAAYIFTKTKSFLKTLSGLVASYFILFFSAATPSLIYYFSNLFFADPLKHPVFGPIGAFRQGSLSDYITMEVINAVLLIFIVAGLVVLLYISNKSKFKFLMWLFCPSHLAPPLVLGAFGLLLGHSTAGSIGYGFYDLLFSLTFLLSAVAAYQFARLVDDLSNSNQQTWLKIRPKPGELRTTQTFAVIFAVLSLMLAYPLGADVIIVMVTLLSLLYLYSAPPLRLNRQPLMASFVVASCAFLLTFGGFTVFAREEATKLFPPGVTLGLIIVAFSLMFAKKKLSEK